MAGTNMSIIMRCRSSRSCYPVAWCPDKLSANSSTALDHGFLTSQSPQKYRTGQHFWPNLFPGRWLKRGLFWKLPTAVVCSAILERTSRHESAGGGQEHERSGIGLTRLGSAMRIVAARRSGIGEWLFPNNCGHSRINPSGVQNASRRGCSELALSARCGRSNSLRDGQSKDY